MNRNACCIAAAAVILAGCVPALADTLRRHSFSSSVIARALSKFRDVKGPGQVPFRSVATAVRVDPAVGVVQSGVLPKKDGPPPQTPAQSLPHQTPPPQKQAPAKAGSTPTITSGTTSGPVIPTVVTQQDVHPTTPTPSTSSPAPTTTQPAPPPQTTASAVPPAGTISDTISGEDIKQVMSEVSVLAGVTIIPDDTIKEQNISIDFKADPIDDVVNKLASMAGAYWKEERPGFFLISKATPEAALFSRFAVTKIYAVKNKNAAAIQAVLSPTYKNYISVHPKTNTIGVCAPQRLMEKIFADVEAADMPARQVSVEGLVTEISLEDMLNTGFSWTANNFGLNSSLGITYTQASAADMALIQAAITNHKMNLRANPHLIATAGVELTVSVGQDTYYSLLSGSTIYPTSQIQLIHTGTILTFTAFVGDDGMITMQLNPSVSDSVVQVNGNPTSNIRTATTTLRVKSGQTIVIAGLVQDTGSWQIVRVPILGYIPLIGEIFSQRTYDKKKVETIFIITPKLITGQ